MSDSLSAEFPSSADLDEIRERFSAAFVQGRFFPEGHECSPYIRLANDVQPLLREVERLWAVLLQFATGAIAPSDVCRTARAALGGDKASSEAKVQDLHAVATGAGKAVERQAEANLKQAREARAEVQRLRREIAIWVLIWDDADLLEARVEALRNGTAILGSAKSELGNTNDD